MQDRVGALYFVLTNQIMSSSASMRTFLAERDIVGHELRGGLYRLPAYFVSRSAAESLWQLLGATLFGALTYRLVGFGGGLEQQATFLGVVALVTLCAESYVVCVGALMPDEKSAAVVGPLFLALCMATGGLFVNSGSVPPLFQVFNRVNIFSYGFSALLQNEMAGLELHCSAAELKAAGRAGCATTRGEQVVERMALGSRSVGENVAALLAILCALRLAAFLALRRRYRRQ